MPTRCTHSVALGVTLFLAVGCAPASTAVIHRPASELAALTPITSAAETALQGNPGLISNNIGSFRGVIQGPSATLISNNASNVIGDQGASLIGNNAAGLIGNNAGGLTGDYGLLAAPTENAPLARVAVFDERDQMVSDGWLNTDEEGQYHFERLKPSGPLLFVRATYTVGTTAVTLQALADAPREAGTRQVKVTPATTLVAKKVDHMIREKKVQPGTLRSGTLEGFTAKVESAMTDTVSVAAAILQVARVAGVFDQVVENSPELKQALTSLGAASPGAGLLTSSVAPKAPPDVSTLAGGSAAGYQEGTGPDAHFNYPYGVAIGPGGQIYLSDLKNHCIRQVTPDGKVTTLAGNNTAGFADGSGTAARFNGPRGLTVDAQGNMLVADGDNARIRKVTPAGVVTTLAGTGQGGFADGPAGEAMFKDPRAVVVDTAGDVYVADTGNLRIRKIDGDGIVTTYLELPQPQGTASHQLRGPYGLAIDGQGVLFVADASSNAVLKVPSEGSFSIFAGGGEGQASGQGAEAQFNGPVALGLAGDGRLYVADFFNHSVRVVSPTGQVSTLAGTGSAGLSDGEAATARFYGPYGVAVGMDGYLYVADTSNHRLRKIKLN